MEFKLHPVGKEATEVLCEGELKQAGTWDLGHFAAVLAPGQTSPQ